MLINYDLARLDLLKYYKWFYKIILVHSENKTKIFLKHIGWAETERVPLANNCLPCLENDINKQNRAFEYWNAWLQFYTRKYQWGNWYF